MQLDLQLFAAITAIVVALLAWLQARDAARLRAGLEAQLEQLRAQLSHQQARHDAALRLGIETRVGLFKDSTRAVAAAERLFAIAADEVMSAVHELVDADEARNLQPIAETRLESVRVDFPRQYSEAGLFLPPELDDAADRARSAILKANTLAIRLTKRDDAVTREDRPEIVDPMVAALGDYRARARDWKRRHWSAWDLVPGDAPTGEAEAE